jgi:hypothetical protein
MRWDWSTAGKLKNGKPYEEDDSLGNHTYMSIKGSFVWARHVKPEYVWFNGTASHYLLGDTNTQTPILINQLHGSYADHDAKIIPVKIHRATQPFDPINHTLIQPKLYSLRQGEGAFWRDFDWNRASEEGMKAVGQPFSDSVAFVETEMTWPVNHMVSPKSKAVPCGECHSRDDSRLAALRGFYMPGRDYNLMIDKLGLGAMLVTLFGIAVHSSARVYVGKRRKENHS